MAVVVLVSYTLTWLATMGRRRRPEVRLTPDQKIRLLAPGGAYRSRFLRECREGLVVQAPLQRDVFVPLRVGSEVVVQAPHSDGLYTFRCLILSRSVDCHEYVLSLPDIVRNTERRSEPRLTPAEGQVATLNQQPAHVLNVSAGGARVLSFAFLSPGDYVSLSLSEFEGSANGFVLETTASVWQGRAAQEARIWFEEPFAGLSRPTKFKRLTLVR